MSIHRCSRFGETKKIVLGQAERKKKVSTNRKKQTTSTSKTASKNVRNKGFKEELRRNKQHRCIYGIRRITSIEEITSDSRGSTSSRSTDPIPFLRAPDDAWVPAADGRRISPAVPIAHSGAAPRGRTTPLHRRGSQINRDESDTRE